MSNVNIYEKSWIDLVFEGKNKAYGAYQLRQQDSRTTITAFFYGLLFLVSVSGIGVLFSSFGEKPATDTPEFVDPFIHVTTVNTTPETEKPKPREAAAASKPTEETNKKVLDNNVVVVSNQPVDNLMTNEEAKKNPTPSTEPQGTGTGLNPNPGGTPGGTALVPATPTNTGGSDKPEVAPDVMPEYPGGIQRFYDYVGNNFDREDIEGIKTATVIMSFVVEKDGKMSDIKVLRSPGHGLDKEAIRVLKSIRTKWKPGIKNGESVRTQYTLPITVKI